MREIVVDARWLEPPEPMERVLAALEKLEPDEKVRMLIHRIPHLLFPVLRDWGYGFEMRETEVGTYEIEIWFLKKSEPKRSLD